MAINRISYKNPILFSNKRLENIGKNMTCRQKKQWMHKIFMKCNALYLHIFRTFHDEVNPFPDIGLKARNEWKYTPTTCTNVSIFAQIRQRKWYIMLWFVYMYPYNISKVMHSNIKTKEGFRRFFGDKTSFLWYNARFKPGTKYGWKWGWRNIKPSCWRSLRSGKANLDRKIKRNPLF